MISVWQKPKPKKDATNEVLVVGKNNRQRLKEGASSDCATIVKFDTYGKNKKKAVDIKCKYIVKRFKQMSVYAFTPFALCQQTEETSLHLENWWEQIDR